MSVAYLGLGSNVNARSNITGGIEALRAAFGQVDLSPAYQTRSVGFDGEDFINLVARIETGIQPIELKRFLRDLEDSHGRLRNVPKFSDRTLDIDILFYDDLYLVSPTLEIPRAEILKFTHILKPLVDLAPDLLHPIFRITIREMWQRHDPTAVKMKLLQL